MSFSMQKINTSRKDCTQLLLHMGAKEQKQDKMHNNNPVNL